jgi:DNA-binding transcriptional regulator YbjK
MVSAARPRGAARREALLEAVLEVVASAGPEAVTHRRVAEAAGLPLASTTYWFSSKDELLTAALEHAADRDIARLRAAAAALADVPADEPQRIIDGLVALIVEPLERGLASCRGSLIASYSLWLEAARRPALRAIARRWTDAYHEVARGLLERAGDPRAAVDAQILIGAADGMLMATLAGGERGELTSRLRRLVEALLCRQPPMATR